MRLNPLMMEKLAGPEEYSAGRDLEETGAVKIAEEDKPCVIVGRCADYILKEYDDVFNVFIHADMEFRKDRIVRLYGESENKPEKRLIEKDKKRKTNYKYYTNQDWGDSVNYDLSLDSSFFGVDKCAEIICDLVRKS